MALYKFQVITPQGVAYSGDVTHVRVPAEDGFTGVLANHAPFVTSSAGGLMEVREENGGLKKFKVGSGFFEVQHNQAVFLTQVFSESSQEPL